MASSRFSTLVLTATASSSWQTARRSAIRWIVGRPAIDTNTLLGRRVEPIRAWIAATTWRRALEEWSSGPPVSTTVKPARSNAIRDAAFSRFTTALIRRSASGPKASRERQPRARGPTPRPRHSGAMLTLTAASLSWMSSRTMPASTPSALTMNSLRSNLLRVSSNQRVCVSTGISRSSTEACRVSGSFRQRQRTGQSSRTAGRRVTTGGRLTPCPT